MRTWAVAQWLWTHKSGAVRHEEKKKTRHKWPSLSLSRRKELSISGTIPRTLKSTNCTTPSGIIGVTHSNTLEKREGENNKNWLDHHTRDKKITRKFQNSLILITSQLFCYYFSFSLFFTNPKIWIFKYSVCVCVRVGCFSFF